MGKANTAVNTWLSDSRRFADLFNGAVFGGRQIVQPEELRPLNKENDVIITDKTGQEKNLQRFRDIVMQWKKGPLLAVLACESQDKVHYAMPVRNMLYDSLSYTEQIRLIWKQQTTGQKTVSEDSGTSADIRRMTVEEYLSHFRRDDRLFPVITLVFYYDLKKWDGALDLYDMFRLDAGSEEQAVLRRILPNYHINLIDAGNVSHPGQFHSDLQQVFGMLKYRGEKELLQNYMEENRAYFGNVDVETYHALRVFLHSEKMLQEISNPNREERIDMCQALEDIYADGLRKGEEEGFSKGEEACLNSLIQKKLAKGKSVAQIADELEETEDAVRRQIQKIAAARKV